MNTVLSILLALCLVALVSAQQPNLSGRYRQCNADDGAETTLDISASDLVTNMVYRFGGCTGTDEYDVQATFTMNFESQRSDGGWNVNYSYNSASLVAIPYNDDAEEALENTCPGLTFTENSSTNVASCLFCPGGIRYDILLETTDGFVLGDSIACSASERPTQYEESEFFFESFLSTYYTTVDSTYDARPDTNSQTPNTVSGSSSSSSSSNSVSNSVTFGSFSFGSISSFGSVDLSEIFDSSNSAATIGASVSAGLVVAALFAL